MLRYSVTLKGIALAALIAGLNAATPALAGPDEDAIGRLLHTMFDRPDGALTIEPTVISSGYAVAGWTQGDMGGRAVLRLRDGGWALILCGGDGVKSAEALRQAGMPADGAEALARRLAEAERAVAPERLAQFAKFEGILTIDGAGHPPPAPTAQNHQTQHKH